MLAHKTPRRPPVAAGHLLCLIVLVMLHHSSAAETPAVSPLSDPVPLPRAHAHNDYAHARPLLDALDCGFCSVEADVFLVDGDLLVAHDQRHLQPERTLTGLYLDPLRRRIQANGGRVYRDGPAFLLFVDLKSEGESTYAALHRQLSPYADILTRYSNGETHAGPVTIIVSGNCPRATLAAQSLRLAACDGRRVDFDSDVSKTLVPVISERWGGLFAWRGSGPVPEKDANKLKELVGKAHARGRLVRFWGAPDNPEAWKVLCEAGVDLINTDKLTGLRDFLRATPRPDHPGHPR